MPDAASTFKSTVDSLPSSGASNWLKPLTPTTLRSRTVLIILVTVAGLVIGLGIPLRLVVLGGFIAVEEQQTRQNVQRATNALANELKRLSGTAASYGVWDETYRFISEQHQQYLDDNLADETMVLEQLNLFVLYDAADALLAGKAYDLVNEQAIPVPHAFQQLTSDTAALFAGRDTLGGTTGLLLLPEGPMLLAVQPILPNSGQGPANGTLIMGRLLDDGRIKLLAETTQLSLTLQPLNGGALSDDVASSRDELLAGAEVVTRSLDDRTIAGYTLLRDINAQPILVLRLEAERVVYAQGLASTWLFSLSLIAAGVLFGLIVLYLLQRGVLRRLTGLGADVARVGAQADLSARVDMTGTDELAHLAQSINAMLNALEDAQTERRQAEEERARVQEAFVRQREQLIHMTIHDLKTPLTVMIGFLDMLKMTGLDDRQREFNDGARRGSAAML